MTAPELWLELSSNLRSLRVGCGLSLRQLEQRSGWGRGTLSQIENAKARPTRAQVEWYDDHLGGDGLLVSIYAEARGAHGPAPRHHPAPPARSGDEYEVVDSVLARGEAVDVGSTVVAGWTIRNRGCVSWRGRRLHRVGAHHARRLLASAPAVVVPDCDPGGQCDVHFDVVVPDEPGSLAAYFQLTDDQGGPCFAAPALLALMLQATAGT